MKKLLSYFSVLLILSIVLSSCGKGMYITKRKYNKGFYVSRSHKKNEVKAEAKTAKVENKQSAVKKEAAEEATALHKEAVVAGSEAVAASTKAAAMAHDGVAAGKQQAVAVNSTEPASASAFQSKKNSKSLLTRSGQVQVLDRVIPNAKIRTELKNKAHDVHGALSLIWIIILIILLVYLIALLFDAFGLGWFIHILALIALILLILWLLRVI